MARPTGLAGYVPVEFANFAAGLNLRDKADVVSDSECIDCLNVDFLERGAIKQRDGYADLTGALTNRVDSLGVFYAASGTRQLLAGCGTRLEALSTAGAVVASKTGLAGGPYVFCRFAAPGSEYAYCANGSDTTQRWDGSAWTSGAASATVNGTAASAMPKAGSVCITANTNRMLATAYGTGTTNGPGGTTSNPSRAHWSNAGAPETWETDGASGRAANFVDFTPGDGEQIMGSVTWRELTFIFKESKFFVVYGESVSSTGTPVFNYRTVSAGVGLAAKQAVCIARDGVYFMDHGGVYVTTGGDPKLLSDKVSPIWGGSPDVYFQSDPLNMTQIALCRLAWDDVTDQIYLAFPSGTATANDRVLKYDTEFGWWTLYDLPASALIAFRRAEQPEMHFGYSSGGKIVGRLNAGATVDPSNAVITSRWRSGWGDYNSPVIKTVRESKLWGSGAATVSFSKDFEVAPAATDDAIFGGSSTWPTTGTWADWIALNNGVWPGGGQVNAVLIRKAVRGTVFSTQFADNAASASWSVHRVARHLREQRVPSVEHTS